MYNIVQYWTSGILTEWKKFVTICLNVTGNHCILFAKDAIGLLSLVGIRGGCKTRDLISWHRYEELPKWCLWYGQIILQRSRYVEKTIDFLMTETRRDTALSNYDLVTFFPCGWETPWRGHYLIKSLSEQLRNSKILCVENPVDFVISPVKHCPELIMQLNRKDRLRKVSDNLFIYRPWIFLNVHIAARISIFQRLNIGWIKIQLDKLRGWKTDAFRSVKFEGSLKLYTSIMD